jgi:hypothetical protein
MSDEDLPQTAPETPPAPPANTVLDGWDIAGDPYVRTQDDAPFPVDLAALVGGAIAGKLLALAVRKSSIWTAATLGTVVGAGIAIGARRMWRLEP